MSRNVFIDHKKRICFFWAPKCASRSLSGWLASIYISPGNTKNSAADRALARTIQFDFATGAMMAMEHGYLSIAMVRHPARRIASAFVSKFVHGRGKPLTSLDRLERFALDVVETIRAERGDSDAPYRGITFIDLLDYIEKRMAQAAPGEDADLNPHWNAQTLPVLQTLGLTFDHVCAVEELADDFAPVSALYGNTQSIVERNTSPYAATPQKQDLSRALSVDIANEAFSSKAFLTEETLARIARIYARDYEILGYDPMDINSLPSLRANNATQLKQKPMRAVAQEWLASRGAGGTWAKLKRARRKQA